MPMRPPVTDRRRGRPAAARRVGPAGVLIGLALVSLGACDRDGEQPRTNAAGAPAEAAFVGAEACGACHAEALRAWQGSHHRLAMQAAGATTVHGDFDDAEFVYNGVTTRFFRRDGAFWVNTDAADGTLRDFPVRFSFGAEPLQQYLLETGAGRLQALAIAWDTRPAEQGGQRWFHLYPDEGVEHGDPLHWTGIYLNWNSSCAECHSTNLTKNYLPDQDRFETAWSSPAVDCEACHGPGSAHAASPADAPLPLGAVPRAWAFTEPAAIAGRVPQSPGDAELEVCAQCHSRRSQLHDRYRPGDAFLDAHVPALLDAGLYHADGQILDEVYVYGSFLQSRMHAAGVTCSDCHDPHSGGLRAAGNALCGQCHLPTTFDTPRHHRHTPGSAGAECVGCHMPDRTYMIVDDRRDHSFRVPRPDLSVSLGTPNACNGCHADASPQWAAARLAEWFPDGRGGEFHYAEAIDAGRRWSSDRGELLRRVVDSTGMPGIVRATALRLLAEQIDDAVLDRLERALRDTDPLMQWTALEAMAEVPASLRVDWAQRFLSAPLAALRIAAARALVPVRDRLGPGRRAEFDVALEEFIEAQRFNADRAEGWLNLGNLRAELGEAGEAEASYRAALERQPEFAPAYLNLADLYRRLGRDGDALRTIEAGLRQQPGDAALRHALGLALTRADRRDEALAALRAASETGAATPRYRYVYGVALHSAGQVDAALEVLADAHARFPGYAPVLFALATMSRDAGRLEQAREYARRLLELSPADTTARALAAELGPP